MAPVATVPEVYADDCWDRTPLFSESMQKLVDDDTWAGEPSCGYDGDASLSLQRHVHLCLQVSFGCPYETAGNVTVSVAE
jgi:hypothetical protein